MNPFKAGMPTKSAATPYSPGITPEMAEANNELKSEALRRAINSGLLGLGVGAGVTGLLSLKTLLSKAKVPSYQYQTEVDLPYPQVVSPETRRQRAMDKVGTINPFISSPLTYGAVSSYLGSRDDKEDPTRGAMHGLARGSMHGISAATGTLLAQELAAHRGYLPNAKLKPGLNALANHGVGTLGGIAASTLAYPVVSRIADRLIGPRRMTRRKELESKAPEKKKEEPKQEKKAFIDGLIGGGLHGLVTGATTGDAKDALRSFTITGGTTQGASTGSLVGSLLGHATVANKSPQARIAALLAGGLTGGVTGGVVGHRLSRSLSDSLLGKSPSLEPRWLPKFSSVKRADLASSLVAGIMPTKAGDPQPMTGSPGWLRGDTNTSVPSIPWAIPAATLAGLGGLYGGHQLVRHIISQKNKRELAQELDAAQKEYENAMLAQYDPSKLRNITGRKTASAGTSQLDVCFDQLTNGRSLTESVALLKQAGSRWRNTYRKLPAGSRQIRRSAFEATRAKLDDPKYNLPGSANAAEARDHLVVQRVHNDHLADTGMNPDANKALRLGNHQNNIPADPQNYVPSDLRNLSPSLPITGDMPGPVFSKGQAGKQIGRRIYTVEDQQKQHIAHQLWRPTTADPLFHRGAGRQPNAWGEQKVAPTALNPDLEYLRGNPHAIAARQDQLRANIARMRAERIAREAQTAMTQALQAKSIADARADARAKLFAGIKMSSFQKDAILPKQAATKLADWLPDVNNVLGQGAGYYLTGAGLIGLGTGVGTYKYLQSRDERKLLQDALKRRAMIRALSNPSELYVRPQPVEFIDEDQPTDNKESPKND